MNPIYTSIRFLFMFTLLTGLAYPLAVTLVAQSIFPTNANGSLIQRNGQNVGSLLIAQGFKEDRYFWPRASAVDYNPLPSGGSNLSPTNKDLRTKVTERRAAGLVGDLAFASASGLDPHISPVDAKVQVARVAQARRLNANDTARLQTEVENHVEERQFGIFGEPRVNILKLNLAIEEGFH